MMAQDITEARRAKSRLIYYQKQLQSLVSELSLVEQAERRRLAAELHDGIGQILAAARITCHELQERLSTREDCALAEQVGQLIAQVIGHVRSVTCQLSPTVLYELGFEAAIEWLAEITEEKYKLVCDYQTDDQPKPLSTDTSVVLFQSVRELVRNAVGHGNADHLKIVVWREDSSIRVLVQDNGVGFDTTQMRSLPSADGGFGLFSIRERLEALGGSSGIESEPGGGTQVHLRAPLEAKGQLTRL